MSVAVAGRTALVTGAGNGLGRAIALQLAVRGARLILAGRNAQTLDAVAAEIDQQRGGQARVAICDTSDELSVENLTRTLSDESISIVVNNAGIAGPVASLIDILPGIGMKYSR